MSRHLDAALRALDVGRQHPTPKHAGMYLGRSMCWRCQRHPSRVPGSDVLCEGCFAWMTCQTDDDPKQGWG